MNNTELAAAVAVGVGLAAGVVAAIVVFAVLFYILMVVAMWKMFVKAGEAGWKCLIPIYNLYIFCKIIGINFWIWMLLVPLVVGLITGLVPSIAPNNETLATIMSIISAIYSIVFYIYTCYKLAKAFGKGVGFTIGLFFFPNIFQLILAFGSAEYVGTGK